MIVETTIDAVRNSDLTAPERWILVTLASFADHETGANAWPSAYTLADITGHGRRTVAAALKVLEAGRWIERTGTAKRGVVVWKITPDEGLFAAYDASLCRSRTQETPDVCDSRTQATGIRPVPDQCPTSAHGAHNQDPYQQQQPLSPQAATAAVRRIA